MLINGPNLYGSMVNNYDFNVFQHSCSVENKIMVHIHVIWSHLLFNSLEVSGRPIQPQKLCHLEVSGSVHRWGRCESSSIPSSPKLMLNAVAIPSSKLMPDRGRVRPRESQVLTSAGVTEPKPSPADNSLYYVIFLIKPK